MQPRSTRSVAGPAPGAGAPHCAMHRLQARSPLLRPGRLPPRGVFGAGAPDAGRQSTQRRRQPLGGCAVAAASSEGALSGNGAAGAARRAAARQERGPLDDTYIKQLVWQHKGHIFKAAAALLVCVVCNLGSPVAAGFIFEILAGQARGGYQSYGRVFAIFATLYIVEPIMTWVYITNVCTLSEKVLASLRAELFRVLLLQKVEFFDQHSASQLTGLISSELDAVRSFVFRNASRDRGPRAVLEATGAVAVLIGLSWRLGPVVAVLVVCAGATAATYSRQTKAVEKANAAAAADMTGTASEAFQAITTVRSFAGEALERERFGASVQRSFAAGLGFGRAKAALETLNRSAIHASLLLLYGLGGWLIARGLLPFRALSSAVGFTFSLLFATQGVLSSVAEASTVTAALRRIQSTLAAGKVDPSMAGALPPGAWWEYVSSGRPVPPAEPYGIDAGDAAMLAARHGPLELRDVCFSYPLRPDRAVLQELSLRLRPGTVTALVGRSGAGKSTVAALLARFYEPHAGAVLLDGRPAAAFTRGEWARAVSVVQQEPVLFGGTVADNIAYGRYGRCTQEEIETAAQAANAHEFIEQLPERYETQVGGRGALLSGGQRQRIALARALIKGSPIIILDEATSALDAVSERLVQQAIETLVAGRTVLVIAHRLSTVQAAQQIVVVDGGRVAEVGTHAGLVAQKGLYASLVSSQSLSLSNV